jgi:hypothetical protein
MTSRLSLHIYTPNSLHIPYDLPFTSIKFINLTLLHSFAYEKIRMQKVRMQKVRMQKVLDASDPEFAMYRTFLRLDFVDVLIKLSLFSSHLTDVPLALVYCS